MLTLNSGSNALLLHTPDVLSGKLSSQVRILGERLKITATQWSAVKAHCWCQEDVCISGLDFVADVLADFVDQLGVPSCGQRDAAWKECSLTRCYN